jgi:hypothetical protein
MHLILHSRHNTWQTIRSFLSFIPVIAVIFLFLEPEKCDIPELCVKEWVWSKINPYQSPDLVKAEQIGWAVPTIQRLWFGYVLFMK